jgi:hypothetical protein
MSQLLTVGQLARRAGLSRSTLLHYEGLGLLSAAAGALLASSSNTSWRSTGASPG